MPFTVLSGKGNIEMGVLVKVYSTFIWIALSLAMADQLKGCTIEMMGLAAANNKSGMMSYSKFNRQLTGAKTRKK